MLSRFSLVKKTSKVSPGLLCKTAHFRSFNLKFILRNTQMGKAPSTNVNITHTDRQIIFRSTGDLDLRIGEGVPVAATGNPKDKNAQVHGQVTGPSVLIHNPA
jgi:hypothetical protein